MHFADRIKRLWLIPFLLLAGTAGEQALEPARPCRRYRTLGRTTFSSA
jgi:hypothetical protein